ncbi:hypothetical protein H0E84_18655 [Luteimonas sp. SJ-92]|uniref:Uncharacterized protein n=1 Tax=Luteimonas salinisoli TaxID=2752307 RepID=A0A853JJ43_9GAMM|nr:DUF6445 family protein [Luteimonas salinisoli]NZA28400.1 hypothetical protein [Luteimonas salinisoli]
MILKPHPELRVRRFSIGEERAPLLVIDDLVADPGRLVRKAIARHYVAQQSMFPGIRAPAPLSYQAFLQEVLTPLLPAFGLASGSFAFPMAHYSLVTRPPQELAFLQRIPHIDSVSGSGLATVHYLFRGDWGGTAFYRHRRTGFESVGEERREAYFRCLDEESRGGEAPSDGYISGDTALFERIGRVEGVYNRLVVYRRNSLHSGDIDNDRVPPADPTAGRLSINTFIDVSA